MSRRTSLYRHFDADGRLLYVGISLSAAHRLAEHRRTARWFGDICSVTIEHYDTREEALEAERTAIKSERPLFNIMHNSPANDNHQARRGCVSRSATPDVENWDDIVHDSPRVYLIRDAETHLFHGFFWAASLCDLWDCVDEFADPVDFEFALADADGGLFHTDGVDGAAIEDDTGGRGWTYADFDEAEGLIKTLMHPDRLSWERFCTADEDYGLIARIEKQASFLKCA